MKSPESQTSTVRPQPTIAFLLPVATQPRYRKRIRALGERRHCSAMVLACEREYIPDRSEFDYTPIGRVTHGSYANRFAVYLRALPRVARLTRRCDVLYCFEYDMLLLGRIANMLNGNRAKTVYEIGDIREVALEDSLRGRLVRAVERLFVRGVDILVATSPAFLEEYYGAMLHVRAGHHLVLENKLLEPPPVIPHRAPADGRTTIGFFGLLRCARSWKLLRSIADNDGFRVVVYGYPFNLPGFDDELAGSRNVDFRGNYDGYEELHRIYNEVDIVWACYPFDTAKPGNWQWARTNRFYESCYFRKPMIVQKGTQDAARVRELDIGLVIDMGDPAAAIAAARNITAEDLERWARNLDAVPQSVYMHGTEHDELLEILCQLLSAGRCRAGPV